MAWPRWIDLDEIDMFDPNGAWLGWFGRNPGGERTRHWMRLSILVVIIMDSVLD
jgi:hypothetical protein